MRAQLSSRFSRTASVLRADTPLSNEQIAHLAPSIFANAKHDSRSGRYTYIPTSDILESLRKEGFHPFYVCQARVRDEGRREHAKHMLRLRHASQITGSEANEVVLLNSHDGSSSYQMLAGVYRFVCCNGMVCGETIQDVRVPHKGDVVRQVIEGAYAVLDEFDMVVREIDNMRQVQLTDEAQQAFAESALLLKYENPATAPIEASKLLSINRTEDIGNSLWVSLNRVQENMIRGGIKGRSNQGHKTRTRAVTGIDGNIALNRALWALANKMSQLMK